MPTPPNQVVCEQRRPLKGLKVTEFSADLLRRRMHQGFTLVVTLVILAAVTILVVGLYSIVERESQTSASYDAVDQADLAVQSGLEHAGVLLKEALADEMGVIFSAPLTPNQDDKQRSREMLIAANFDKATEQWKYQPLASGVALPASSERLQMPAAAFEQKPSADPAVGPSVEESLLETRKLPVAAPWQARVPRYWMQIRLPGAEGEGEPDSGGEEGEVPEEGKLVARYSFYVEDLQGKISLANAGIHDRDKGKPHFQEDLTYLEQTTAPDTPALPLIPGLYVEPNARWRRMPVSVWTLLQPDHEPVLAGSVPKAANILHDRLTAINSKRLAFSPDMWRELLISPDPLTNWPGIDPLRLTGGEARLPNGSLADAQLRAIEENTTSFLTPYDELALVPPVPGFAVTQVGGRKLNLNKVLHDIEGDQERTDQSKMTQAVEQVAEHIHRHIPRFGERAGGYPLPRAASLNQSSIHRMAYLKGLVAGMIDYADRDPLPSINVAQGGAGSPAGEAAIEYRGTDSFPLVNEYWQRHRFEEFRGREVECSLTDYVELWNPTDQVVKGNVTCCFEYRGRFAIGLQQSYDVMNSLDKVITGRPSSVPGLNGLWFAEQYVELQPNEIRVVSFPPVRFRLDGGSLGNITGVEYKGQPANGNDDRESKYRLAFKPAGHSSYTVVDLPFAALERYHRTTSLSSRQSFNVNQPGLSYRVRDQNWAFNVGDTRAAYFIDYHQEVIDYGNGSSPWGRNHRHADDPQGFTTLAGESRTYLWPDGGHNTIPRSDDIDDSDTNPDDASKMPAINPTNSAVERQKFVQRISNRGRFYSMTELGHVFDPIMWCPRNTTWSGNDQPSDDKIGYDEHADLKADLLSTSNPSPAELDAHKRFCGGNSLRIGRVEHSLFRPDYRKTPDDGRPQTRALTATSLLDVLHCGDANSTDVERFTGPLVRIDGHVNVNTASKETLRALVAGRISTDPLLKSDSSLADKEDPVLLAPTSSRTAAQADIIAEAIIQNRPYVTPAEVADKAVLSPEAEANLQPHEELPPLAANVPVFGYTKLYPDAERRVQPEWSDAAAEETFARLWNNSTVRSRHFQIVVVGQTVKVGREGRTNVISTRSRLYHVFVKPVRSADGTLQKQEIEITYSRAL